MVDNCSFNQLILPTLPEQDDKDLDVERFKRAIPKLLNNAELKSVKLPDEQLADLVSFMHALTDKSNGRGLLGKPGRVPSGLAVE